MPGPAARPGGTFAPAGHRGRWSARRPERKQQPTERNGRREGSQAHRHWAGDGGAWPLLSQRHLERHHPRRRHGSWYARDDRRRAQHRPGHPGRRWIVVDSERDQFLPDGTFVLTWQLHWVSGWAPEHGEYRAVMTDNYGHADSTLLVRHPVVAVGVILGMSFGEPTLRRAARWSGRAARRRRRRGGPRSRPGWRARAR